jgi:hypothetical protein
MLCAGQMGDEKGDGIRGEKYEGLADKGVLRKAKCQPWCGRIQWRP